MSFIWHWLLITLFLIPIFVWVYLRLDLKRRQSLAELGQLGLVGTRSRRNTDRNRHIIAGFLIIGLSLLLFSFARPEMFTQLPSVEGTVILAFDVSNSMEAEDLQPTRIEAAKAAAKTFLEKQPSSIMIGVVAFSNGGLVLQPPTDEQSQILASIDRLTPQGATSLGQGIFSSLNAIAGEAISIDSIALEDGTQPFDIGTYPSSVILLLTDGENTSTPNPLEIAQIAAEAGVRIYTIGIGSAEGSVLQIEGFNILSQLNEMTLKEISAITNGAYFHAADAESLSDIYENVDLMLAVRGEKMEVTAIFAGIGLLFFLIGGLLSLYWFGRMPL